RSTDAQRTPGPAALTGLTLHRMTAEDDAQSFLEAFEAMAEACSWPAEEWSVRLLPLLSGEAQTAAMGLPPAARRDYASVRKAVTDRLGLLPEDHRRRFRQTRLEPGDRPFAYGQRLKDAANRWLLPNGVGGKEAVMEKVVLEQFAEGLPARTAAWVKYHRPPTLKAAITLAEDHLAVHPSGQRDEEGTPSPDRPARRRGGQPQPVERPVPAPRRTSFLPARYPPTAPMPFPTHRGVLKRRGRNVGAWREAESVALVSAVPEREELGPEVPKAADPTPLPYEARLSEDQRTDIAQLQKQFADVFSPLPGRTDLIAHRIETPPGVTSSESGGEEARDAETSLLCLGGPASHGHCNRHHTWGFPAAYLGIL
uniref:zinc finger protein 165-like n=1 Tax=Gasterosteus aculeatus aculeatus TaxID=481459 RepID=UPI001A98CFC2